MLSSTGEPRVRWSVARACRLAALLAISLAVLPAATPSLAASAVEVDLGAIDTLPPARRGSAGVPIELRPPAAIRAEIAKREAAQRAAAQRAATERAATERAATERAATERNQAEIARKAATKRRAEQDRRKAAAARQAEEARQRAEADRKEAEKRKMAAEKMAQKEQEARARAAAQPKDLRKAAPKVALKSANKSERAAPPPASKPVTSKPAGQTANRTLSAGKTRIGFAKGSTQLTAAARQNMKPVIQSLSRNSKSRLVIYAYAGGDKARRLSLSRALAVRRHLIKGGIQGTRAEVRALGSNTTEKPIDRVDLVLVGQ